MADRIVVALDDGRIVATEAQGAAVGERVRALSVLRRVLDHLLQVVVGDLGRPFDPHHEDAVAA